MKRCYLRILAVALLAPVFASPALAQKFEVFPYAGGEFWGGFRAHQDQLEKFSLTNPALFGVRGGVIASPNLQFEGNVSYATQFRIRSTFDNNFNPSIHAWQYEAGMLYNFSKAKLIPYLALGAGALVQHISNPDNPFDPKEVTYNVIVPQFINGATIPVTTRQITMRDNNAFLTVSYAGGIKGERLWGPLGFRFDLRGRTVPNFYSETINAFEPTGGLLFTWGEP